MGLLDLIHPSPIHHEIFHLRNRQEASTEVVRPLIVSSTSPTAQRIDSMFSNMDVKRLVKEKKFWFASALVVWAAGLQGHMMWLQRQEAFKQKFGHLNQDDQIAEVAASD